MQTVGKRSRPGDLFLLAILLANLVCGVGLIGALRADTFEGPGRGRKHSRFLEDQRFPLGEDPPVHLGGRAREKDGGGRAGPPERGRADRRRRTARRRELPAHPIRGRGSGFPSSSVLRGIFRTAATSCRSGSSSPADRGRTNTTSSGRSPSRTSAGTSRCAEGSIAGSSTPKETPVRGDRGFPVRHDSASRFRARRRLWAGRSQGDGSCRRTSRARVPVCRSCRRRSLRPSSS